MTIHPAWTTSSRSWRRMPARGFGELLARLRTERGLSQIDLAARAGLNHATVSRLESGERPPTLRAVSRVAIALDLPDGDRASLALAAIDAWREA